MEKLHAVVRYLGNGLFFLLVPADEARDTAIEEIQEILSWASFSFELGIGVRTNDSEEGVQTAFSAFNSAAVGRIIDLETHYSIEEIARFARGTISSEAKFVAYYMPKRPATDLTRIAGYEALARLKYSGENKVISPGDRTNPTIGKPVCFLTAIRTLNCHSYFDKWLLRAIKIHLDRKTQISVNVYATQVRPFSDLVRSELNDEQLKFLEIELLEHEELDEASLQELHRLSRMGVKIAVDDFGKGFSNIGVLSSLPPSSILKIDQSFVRPATDLRPAQQLRIQEAILALAQAHEMDVVFEGVENDPNQKFEIAILDLLDRLGFPRSRAYLQGYFREGSPRPLD